MPCTKYISVTEYLMDRATMDQLPSELVANLNTIVPKANQLLDAFGHYRSVTSGYRRPEDNAKVASPKAHSNHLICAAVDLEDHDGKLKLWCLANLTVLQDLQLWMESPDSTPTWVHVQIFPPKSGNRIFKP